MGAEAMFMAPDCFVWKITNEMLCRASINVTLPPVARLATDMHDLRTMEFDFLNASCRSDACLPCPILCMPAYFRLVALHTVCTQ